MRIAMIGQKGMPAIHGGVERHVHDLSLRLAKNGYEVTVYSRTWYTGKTTDYLLDGVQIKHLPSIHTKHFDAISHTFLATLDAIKNKYEVIHYHGVGPSLLSWLPRIFSRKSLVITTFHSIDRYHQKWNLLARLMLRLGEWTACNFAHKTITVSQSLEKYCLNEFNKETIQIPNGINLFPIKQNNENKIIEEFGLQKNKYFVMISRLVKHKGAHILVEAFCNLKKNHPDNEKIKNLKLAIVGGSTYTNKYVKDLHKLAGICNDIIFTDFQSGDTLEQLYLNSLTLIHPSLNEGLPITVLHAMSYAKPVLVSNISEHQELISNNKFIFRENNVEELEKKMFDFIAMSEEEKQTVGLENRKTIVQFYHWDKIIPQILAVYENKNENDKLTIAEALS